MTEAKPGIAQLAREFFEKSLALDKARECKCAADRDFERADRAFESAKRAALDGQHTGLVTYKGFVVQFTANDVNVIAPTKADDGRP
jgi:hypothetical protein